MVRKDIRAKNERNARNAREGKTKPRAAYADRIAKKPVVSNTALILICFVVIGGVFFELARLFL
ncbi:uncharacterized protein FA14DRAFT_176551 [Meira miltonrushii]|uniref:Stress-associated endoplasmic reticulum protein n=1 Tax=Meira miltonrushii TaxID=1280837 RepID=A0A316VLJ9_9BASI|nr:uncharacterized protein FA14DRAFT_176551 [Meira miltonrushii]PWN37253.1 hypothetical protein FA14DRAFT_176551 [Meira miltonrushii]